VGGGSHEDLLGRKHWHPSPLLHQVVVTSTGRGALGHTFPALPLCHTAFHTHSLRVDQRAEIPHIPGLPCSCAHGCHSRCGVTRARDP
jgi:hypothetical protein